MCTLYQKPDIPFKQFWFFGQIANSHNGWTKSDNDLSHSNSSTDLLSSPSENLNELLNDLLNENVNEDLIEILNALLNELLNELLDQALAIPHLITTPASHSLMASGSFNVKFQLHGAALVLALLLVGLIVLWLFGTGGNSFLWRSCWLSIILTLIVILVQFLTGKGLPKASFKVGRGKRKKRKR